MAKSADAFRTISEVADWLGSPAHVLRFWESKFTQVKPVKRAGGRRYYRPADMLLLGGIKKLLHDDGMTIKGVQKVLREQGIKYVSSLSEPLDGDLMDSFEVEAPPAPQSVDQPAANVLQFQRELDEAVEQYSEDMNAEEDDLTPDSPDEERLAGPAQETTDAGDEDQAATEEPTAISATTPADDTEQPPLAMDDADAVAPAEPDMEASPLEDFASPALAVPEFEPDPADKPALVAELATWPADPEPPTAGATPGPAADPEIMPPETEEAQGEDGPALPSFMTRDAGVETVAHDVQDETPLSPAPPRPEVLDLPPVPADDAIIAPPGLLSRLAAMQGRPPQPGNRAEIASLRDRLAALHARQGTH